VRRRFPRWQEENLGKNLELVAKVRSLAAENGCTPAQLALAWVLAQGEDVIPIPGTTKRKHLEDNIGALAVGLSREELAALGAILPPGAASGERYPENMLKLQDR
jgi:aryl-alcohol dehydrogenase-like predicted oxidoreductase